MLKSTPNRAPLLKSARHQQPLPLPRPKRIPSIRHPDLPDLPDHLSKTPNLSRFKAEKAEDVREKAAERVRATQAEAESRKTRKAIATAAAAVRAEEKAVARVLAANERLAEDLEKWGEMIG